MEFIYMTEAGMPVLEAIKSATVAGADLLGMSDNIGTIEKGKLADVIALDGDPSKIFKSLGRVKFVNERWCGYTKMNNVSAGCWRGLGNLQLD
jgi:imidazolonepropionase-like amidohydrolase